MFLGHEQIGLRTNGLCSLMAIKALQSPTPVLRYPSTTVLHIIRCVGHFQLIYS